MQNLVSVLILIVGIFLISNRSQAKQIETQKIRYGFSQEGRELLANIHHNPLIPSKIAIILTGGIHGNEYMGIVKKISKHLKKDKSSFLFRRFFNSGGVLITIPQVNPDGVSRATRFSASGRDLNRTFLLDHQKHQASETLSLVSFVERFLKQNKLQPVFAADYHCCGSAVLLPRNSKPHHLFYQFLENSLKNKIAPVSSLKKTHEVFGKFFSGTLKDYWQSKYGIPSITYEANSLAEEKLTVQHMNWWNHVSGYFIDQEQNPSSLISTKQSSDKKSHQHTSRQAHSE